MGTHIEPLKIFRVPRNHYFPKICQCAEFGIVSQTLTLAVEKLTPIFVVENFFRRKLFSLKINFRRKISTKKVFDQKNFRRKKIGAENFLESFDLDVWNLGIFSSFIAKLK